MMMLELLPRVVGNIISTTGCKEDHTKAKRPTISDETIDCPRLTRTTYSKCVLQAHIVPGLNLDDAIPFHTRGIYCGSSCVAHKKLLENFVCGRLISIRDSYKDGQNSKEEKKMSIRKTRQINTAYLRNGLSSGHTTMEVLLSPTGPRVVANLYVDAALCPTQQQPLLQYLPRSDKETWIHVI